MSRLFIATVGVSDLQVRVKSKDGSSARIGIHPQSVREIHQRMMDGRLKYKIAENAAGTSFVSGCFLYFGEGGLNVGFDLLYEGDTPELSGDELSLVPAKLISIVDSLRGDHQPSSILVFNTNRQSGANEPVAAGPIIANWLSERFNIEMAEHPGTVAPGKSGWINYLWEEMNAVDGHGGAANTLAVSKIEEALAIFGKNTSAVYLAAGGGIPVYREIIIALARFRYQKANFFEFRAVNREKVPVKKPAETVSPAELIRYRGTARQLVLKGHITSASRFAADAPAAESEKHWRKTLQTAARYLEGQPNLGECPPHWLAPLENESVPRCIWPAMRVEASLRGRRLPEALMWTYSFFDAAVIDHISRIPEVASLKESSREVILSDGAKLDGFLTKHRGSKGALVECKKNKWYYYHGGWATNLWMKYFGTSAMSLVRLDRVLDRQSIKQVRNSLTHSRAEGPELRRARDKLVDSGVWAESLRSGAMFLQQELPKGAINELGITDPASLFSEMVDGIVGEIEKFDL